MKIIILFLSLSLPVSGQILNDCAFRSIVKDSIFHLFEERYRNDCWHIYKRTSKDGIHFSDPIGPLLELGNSGRYDERGQADPTVVKDTIWRMWYDAMNINGVWDSLGYATSQDGEHWVKYGSIMGRGQVGDSKSIHHPVVINYNSIFYMFYSGSEKKDPHIVKNIFLAVGFDGIHFIKRTEPILKAGENNFDKHYVRPSRPFFTDTWNMNYWAYDGKDRRIMRATSDNLIHWNKLGCFAEGDNQTASDAIVLGDGVSTYVNIWFSTYTKTGNFLYYRFEKYEK